MNDSARQPRPGGGGRGGWRSLLALVGLALMGTGVALNEGGAAAGRVLIVVGLPLAILALLLSVFDHGRPRRTAKPVAPPNAFATLAAVASKHDFEWRAGRVAGKLKGKQVRAEARQREGPIEVRALTTHALDLGLAVTLGHGPGDARRPIASDAADFDETYTVRADEPDRGRAIITPRLRGMLLEMCDFGAKLDDTGLSLTLRTHDADALYEKLRLAARAVAEVERAGGGVRCAEPLAADREAWLAFAHRHKLASADTPLAIWGQVDGMAVSAVAVRDAFRQFHFELSCDFATPLDRGLEMRPASGSSQLDRSGEPVGHPAFDKVFVLKARDALDATRLVGGETRAALIELRNRGLQVRLRDRGLWAWVSFDSHNTERTTWGLERMALIGGRITKNAMRFAKPGRPPAGRVPAGAEPSRR